MKPRNWPKITRPFFPRERAGSGHETRLVMVEATLVANFLEVYDQFLKRKMIQTVLTGILLDSLQVSFLLLQSYTVHADK